MCPPPVPTPQVCAISALLVAAASLLAQTSSYFKICAIDAETKRPIPLVELTTTNNITLTTDSAGLIAFDEPGLTNQTVFFHVKSHGYDFPKDGFGIAGVRLTTTRGETATIELKRVNIAERLYRITGQGIYHHATRLGKRAPLEQPNLNGQVTGQDSTLTAIYMGKLYWFWGDTARPSYPLGNFRAAGATSLLPHHDDPGGLDPDVGVNLTYFVDHNGFAKQMAPFPDSKSGLYWLDGLLVQPDASSELRMLVHYSHMQSLENRLDHGIAIFNDDAQIFEQLIALPDGTSLHPQGHPFKAASESEPSQDRRDFWYFPVPYPHLRVPAEYGAILDPAQYESFTPLRPGTHIDPMNQDWDAKTTLIARDEHGHPVWAWKRNTSFLNPAMYRKLVEAGKLPADSPHITTIDAISGAPVVIHRTDVSYNQHRKRWTMIALEVGGTSLLGEIWYAESDAPHGPFNRAVKIVTHDDHSFYNPRLHAYFQQDSGRIVYFEGTYTQTFSGAKAPTPRYDYNQIMYRLDLDHPDITKAFGEADR